MRDKFTIAHFAYDGELLGRSSMAFSSLSERWLDVSRDMLNQYGPVLSIDLGSTLSHFKIDCAAGVCHFRIAEQLAYSAVVLSEASLNQAATLNVFLGQLSQAKPVVAECVDMDDFLARIRGIQDRPALIVVNWLNPEIDEEEQRAMFQLVYHFAGAYLEYPLLLE